MKFTSLAAMAATAVALATGAQATVIYDNLGAFTNGVDPVSSFGPLADSFSTGASPFTLTSGGILINGDPTSAGHTTLSLLADNNTSPGALIAQGTFSDSILNPTLMVVHFSTFIPLAANTRYWIQLSSTDGSTSGWAWSLDTSGVGVGGEYFANTNGVFPNSGGPYQMEIGSNLGGVPEPATWAMMMVGFAGLGAALRSRRKQAVATA